MSQNHTNPFVDVADCPICQRGEPCATNESLINATLKAENDRLREALKDATLTLARYANSDNWSDTTGPDDRQLRDYIVWQPPEDGNQLAAQCIDRIREALEAK